jgi:hypothetical protein
LSISSDSESEGNNDFIEIDESHKDFNLLKYTHANKDEIDFIELKNSKQTQNLKNGALETINEAEKKIKILEKQYLQFENQIESKINFFTN